MRNFFNRPEVNLWTKYLIFQAIHINILLWGIESSALNDSHIKKLQRWVNKSIRRILGISRTQVRTERITDEALWKRFHNIPSIQHMIVLRRMKFLGKIVRGSPEGPARAMLIAFANNARPKRRPITSTKSSLIVSLRIFAKHNGFKVDDKGSLKDWYKEAMDKGFWNTCLERYKARDPNDRTPPQRPRRTNHHHHNTRSSAQPPPPPPTPPRNLPPSPPREPREPPRSNEDQNRGYNPEGVGYNLEDSLGIFDLEQGANWMEIKAEFKRLSRLYHPGPISRSADLPASISTSPQKREILKF